MGLRPALLRLFYIWSALLLANPALAEGQYELAKPLPDCYGRSLQHTNETWVDDPAEIARIRATDGVVSRWRNILRIAPSERSAITFVDLKSAPDFCASNDVENHRFEGIYGHYAFVTKKAYEGETNGWIIDIETGEKHFSDAAAPSASLTGQYLVMTEGGSPEGDGYITIFVFDVSDKLKLALLPGFDATADQKGLATHPSSFVWQDDTSLRLEVFSLFGSPERADPDTRRPAVLSITPTGISVRIEKTGETLTAPFEPVSLQ